MVSAQYTDSVSNDASNYRIWLFACILILFAAYFQSFTRIELRDDELYMYYTGLALIDPAGVESITRQTAQALAQFGYEEEQAKHFDFRYEYRTNYLIHSASIAACRLAHPPSDFYAGSVRNCISHGMFAGSMIVVLIVICALIKVRNRVLLASTITLLSVLFVLLLAKFHLSDYRLSKIDDPILYFLLSWIFFISPGMQFDLFGISARSAFTAGLVAFFVLRWGGYQRHSYLLLLPLSLVHLTYSGIFAFMIVAVDLVSRPAIFKDRVISLSIVGLGGLFFWRESLWESFGGFEIALGAIGTVALLAAAAFAVRLEGATQIKRFLERFRNMEIVKLDILLFFAGAVFISGLAFVMTTGNTLEARFTWMQISSRPLALIRIPVFLGLIVLLYRAIDQKWVDRIVNCLCAVVFSMSVFLIVRTGMYEWSHSDEEASLQELTTKTLSDDTRDLPNILIYYHLLRDLEMGTARLPNLIESERPKSELN